jgi:serralysin
VTINLRQATLEYEFGGGGWLSWADNIYGGYTIANGVLIEDAQGGAGDDGINGNNARNVLEGLGGGDRIYGRGGRDDLLGGAGRDALFGGTGNDDLIGGGGRDALYGGAGEDNFIFLAVGIGGKEIDRILDLGAGDTVDLSAVDADSTTAGNQAFTLVAGFSNTAGEGVLGYDAARDKTQLLLDNDGDGLADLKLVMDGDQTGFGGFVL